MEVKITIENLDKLREYLRKFPAEFKKASRDAALEAIDKELMGVEGFTAYPLKTAANAPHPELGPPGTPYYKRGYGMERAGRIKPRYNDLKSQKYGTGWKSKRQEYGAMLGNKATYGKYLGGDEQVSWAARYGWRKVRDIAHEKLPRIGEIFGKWYRKLVADLKNK